MDEIEKEDYPLVKVVWLDAESCDDWEPIGTKRSCSPIETVGFLIEDTDEDMTLAMNIDPRNQAASMTMTFPNHWVVRVDYLEPVG